MAERAPGEEQQTRPLIEPIALALIRHLVRDRQLGAEDVADIAAELQADGHWAEATDVRAALVDAATRRPGEDRAAAERRFAADFHRRQMIERTALYERQNNGGNGD